MSRGSEGALVGWVYLAGTDEKVKVGHTKDHPSIRLGSLQFGSPVILRELGLVRGTQLIERTLHAYFHDYCWMHEGRWMSEWFHRAPLVDDFIREVASPWDAAMADDVEDDLCVPWDRYAAKISRITDLVVDWFEARDIRPGSLPRGRYGNAKTRSIAGKPRQSPGPAFDASGCPLDYDAAMRPDGLLRAALTSIAPEWRVAFLRLVRGESVIPGLLPYLVACPARLSTVESVLAEASDRMKHFAAQLEDVVDAIPYCKRKPGPSPLVSAFQANV